MRVSVCVCDCVRVFTSWCVCSAGTVRAALLTFSMKWKCLMPLVCSEGLSVFPKMDSHALLITKHSCNGISSFKHSWIFALFLFFLSEGFTVHACSSLAGWLYTSLLWVMFCFCFVVFRSSAQTPPPAALPCRYLLFLVAPRGWLNSRYAETATWWSHPCVQCWQRTAQDKRQR